MVKKALLILADGAEEMEAVITIDTLRRSGVEVTVAGLNGVQPVTCSRSVVIQPDVSLAEVASLSHEVVILPGGLKGAEALSKSPLVGELLKKQEEDGRMVAAICAAPIAFESHGIAKGKRITSYPSMKERLLANYQYVEDRVVVDGKTSLELRPYT